METFSILSLLLILELVNSEIDFSKPFYGNSAVEISLDLELSSPIAKRM